MSIAITEWFPWRSAPRINRASFRELINALALPQVRIERDPGAYWDWIVSRGVDPLFILAKFAHESKMGKAGVATQTKSWGNTRLDPHFGPDPLRDPSGPDGFKVVAGAQGVFPVYANWMDGLQSTVERLLAPNWIYRERPCISHLYDWSPNQQLVWAPRGDANNPESYLRAVIDFMNAHTTERGAGDQAGPYSPPAVRVRYLPEGADNNPGYVLNPEKVTVHETDNFEPGSDAEAHAEYLLEGAVSVPASWHGTVDDSEIWLHLSFLRAAYHAGDGDNGPGNRTSLAFEVCSFLHSNPARWERTLWNLAWLRTQVSTIFPQLQDSSTTVQHNFWTRRPAAIPKGEGPHKDCPISIRHDGAWPHVLDLMAQHYALQIGGTPQLTQPELEEFTYDGKTFKMFGGILRRYRMNPNALDDYGLPIENEHDEPALGEGTRVQRTERARFEWRAGQWPEKFDVTLGLLGVEDQTRRQP